MRPAVLVPVGLAIVHVGSKWPLTAEVRFRSYGSPCWIYGGQNRTGIGLSASGSVFPGQYYPTSSPYSFTHLSPTLYTLSN